MKFTGTLKAWFQTPNGDATIWTAKIATVMLLSSAALVWIWNATAVDFTQPDKSNHEGVGQIAFIDGPPQPIEFADDVEALAWCVLSQRGYGPPSTEQGDELLKQFRARRRKP